MALFRITCVTCTARLSVHNKAAIGQILACPKCGSMVEVTPPPGTLEAAGESPREASATPEPASANGPAPDATPTPDATSTPSSTPSFDEGAEFASATEEGQVETVTEVDAALPEVPSPEWETAAGIARHRLIAWTVSGALAVLGVGGILLTLFSDSPSDSSSASIADVSAAESTATPPEQTPRDDVAEIARDLAAIETESNPAADNPRQATPSPDSADPRSATAGESAQAEQAGAAESELSAPTDQNVPAAAKSTTPQEDVEPAPEADPPASSPRLRIDPLDLDPEGFDLAMLSSSDPSHPSLDHDPQADQRPADEQPTETPQPAGPAPRELEAARRNRDATHRLSTSTVESLLKTKFVRVEVEAMPLCQAVDFATRLSGIPVSVDPTQLRLAGISPTRSVSIRLADGNILELLTHCLQPIRLEPVVRDTQIVLLRVGDNPRRSISYPLDDLIDAETSAETIADWVGRLVAPGAWSGENRLEITDGRLQAQQQERVHYEILWLLERLRLARELPTRTSYPDELLQGTSAYRAAHLRLAGPARFTFSRSTALAEVVDHWEAELGMPILVDWPALEQIDLWPRTEIYCYADSSSWEAALDEVLAPLGLAWTTTDGKTLRMTTREAAASEIQLEFYRMGDGVSYEPEAIQEILDAAAVDAASVWDGASQTLIVRAPASTHRDLAAYLARGQ